MWLPTPTDDSVERFGKLPEIAELGLTDEELRAAATKVLLIGYLMNVYDGTWGPEPGPSGIPPAAEFGWKESSGDGGKDDGRPCGTRADGDAWEEDGAAS